MKLNKFSALVVTKIKFEIRTLANSSLIKIKNTKFYVLTVWLGCYLFGLSNISE